MTKLLEYFTCRQWHWTTDNIRQLLNDMSASDRLVTNCLCLSVCLLAISSYKRPLLSCSVSVAVSVQLSLAAGRSCGAAADLLLAVTSHVAYWLVCLSVYLCVCLFVCLSLSGASILGLGELPNIEMSCSVANVARMNVPILSLKIVSGRKDIRRPSILSHAFYAIIPPEVFCEAKYAKHLFPTGALPWTPLASCLTS